MNTPVHTPFTHMHTPTAIEPTAMYTRSDLVRIYGRTMADRVCKVSRKVCKGRYMGFQVLEAIRLLSDEYEREFQTARIKAAGKVRGFSNGLCEGRAPW